jgi:hypothetical protein
LINFLLVHNDMNEAVLFGFPHNVQGFFFGEASASSPRNIVFSASVDLEASLELFVALMGDEAACAFGHRDGFGVFDNLLNILECEDVSFRLNGDAHRDDASKGSRHHLTEGGGHFWPFGFHEFLP